jgi:hypothetical protein
LFLRKQYNRREASFKLFDEGVTINALGLSWYGFNFECCCVEFISPGDAESWQEQTVFGKFGN